MPPSNYEGTLTMIWTATSVLPVPGGPTNSDPTGVAISLRERNVTALTELQP